MITADNVEQAVNGVPGVGSIMLVARDQDFLRVLQSILGKNHYRLTSTQDYGRSLRQVISAVQPMLIIVDLMAPAMTGIKTALRIRRWTPAATLLLTSWEAGPDALRRLDTQSANYLSEPIPTVELARWINEIVQRAAEDANQVPTWLSGELDK